jgi:hypothetical protein
MNKPDHVNEIWKRAEPLMKGEHWLDAIKLLSERSSGAGKHWKLCGISGGAISSLIDLTKREGI